MKNTFWNGFRQELQVTEKEQGMYLTKPQDEQEQEENPYQDEFITIAKKKEENKVKVDWRFLVNQNNDYTLISKALRSFLDNQEKRDEQRLKQELKQTMSDERSFRIQKTREINKLRKQFVFNKKDPNYNENYQSQMMLSSSIFEQESKSQMSQNQEEHNKDLILDKTLEMNLFEGNLFLTQGVPQTIQTTEMHDQNLFSIIQPSQLDSNKIQYVRDKELDTFYTIDQNVGYDIHYNPMFESLESQKLNTKLNVFNNQPLRPLKLKNKAQIYSEIHAENQLTFQKKYNSQISPEKIEDKTSRNILSQSMDYSGFSKSNSQRDVKNNYQSQESISLQQQVYNSTEDLYKQDLNLDLDSLANTLENEFKFMQIPSKLEKMTKDHKIRVWEARNHGKQQKQQNLRTSYTRTERFNTDEEQYRQVFRQQSLQTRGMEKDEDAVIRYNKYLNKILLLNKDEFFTQKLRAYLAKQKQKQPALFGKLDFFSRMTMDIVGREKLIPKKSTIELDKLIFKRRIELT
ncbi:UNKNOWN [Stylonychia lemnae]|uniref:Uncharacterized protein n=1 Tax=Stylonychia lemnae TaxID=5949 RepID=A0A078AP19_STYLE|nr:UNKNOWN [Stylonychia lemnae]|eukprot:CDW83062.1 UNKNOWN [Stylonychia lemnae]